MRIPKQILMGLCLVFLNAPAEAAEAPGWAADQLTAADHASPFLGPYSGQERRAIKTLSDRDIEDLMQGRGWGLAKAAELNGLPGPKHLLEMKTEIALSPEQVGTIEKVYAKMRDLAIPLGRRLVALESALNQAFARRDLDETRLKTRLDEIGQVRADLRYVHLAAHLRTPQVLSSDQMAAYNRLRGYADPESPAHPHGHR